MVRLVSSGDLVNLLQGTPSSSISTLRVNKTVKNLRLSPMTMAFDKVAATSNLQIYGKLALGQH
jgi:hypothetical protein